MIAARAPVAGATKTRLGKAIGMERAAFLYRAFLKDLASRFDVEWTGFDLAWTYSPPECDFRSELAAVTGVASRFARFVPQDGPDWGVRQLNILMASDSPHLAVSLITSGFDVLNDRDIVLGRVRDGGYYLIGERGFHDVLSTVEMSTSSAADGIVRISLDQGLTVGELPVTFDVDERSDLDELIATLRAEPSRCPATWGAMIRIGLIDGSFGNEEDARIDNGERLAEGSARRIH
jgi:glycosyltransferase A (GT-A) superfamily protein (DUF2064 family)